MNLRQTFGLGLLIFSLVYLIFLLYNSRGQIQYVYPYFFSILIFLIPGILLVRKKTKEIKSERPLWSKIFGILSIILAISVSWFFIIFIKKSYMLEATVLIILVPLIISAIFFLSLGIYFLRATRAMIKRDLTFPAIIVLILFVLFFLSPLIFIL